MLHNTLEACQLDWFNNKPLSTSINCHAKTRYRQADQTCQVEPLANNRIKVRFDQPQRAITPGQSVVFYDADICLGGGIIESKYNTH
jgi:tRNA-specific 2-thiouridylase